VKTVEGVDDFASMREVVGRYFRRRIEESKVLPDLVVIDGGKGQLSSAQVILEEIGLTALPVISLAKREEEIFVPGRSDSIMLKRRSPALRMLQQMRDEAHRFAITFQRQRRSMRTITSELLRIPGIGDRRRRELLHAFGSLEGVRKATLEDIAALPGFSTKTAQKVMAALSPDQPPPGEPPAEPAAETAVELTAPSTD
jgi:excinuclease ABC subunit C